MSPDETLLRESRLRSRMVVVAVTAGLLLLLAAVLQLSGQHAKVNEATLDLLVANQRFPLDLIASVISAIASLTTAWTLVYLYEAAHARNPDKVRPYIRIIAIVGGVLAAVSGVLYQAVFAVKAHDFATTGAQTYEQANRLTGGVWALVLQLLVLAAALLIAMSFVLVSLQAMNQGLLTRFMGYLGMFAGALVLFQITQLPVVQCFWLLAVGYLVSGRWPTGVPPAWRSGRSEPWPSSAEMRARRVAAAGSRGGGRGGRGAAKAAPVVATEPEATPATANGRTRATTSKRKRKRRN